MTAPAGTGQVRVSSYHQNHQTDSSDLLPEESVAVFCCQIRYCPQTLASVLVLALGLSALTVEKQERYAPDGNPTLATD